jgi:acyl-CoA dehydrogenase
MSRHEHIFVDASAEALGRGREILDRGVLALPFYEAAHARLAGEIEAWCERHAPLFPSVEADMDVDAAGRDLVRALGADGWFRHFQSGDGGDFRSICLVREALAYACDLADFAFSIQALSATPVMRYGNEAQRQRYLPAMAAGTLLGSFAISEPDAGSDVAAIKLRADRTANGYVLNGEKTWVANGSIADVHCVLARTGEGPGAIGLSAFLVPACQPGLTISERIESIAPRAFASLRFDNCELPGECLLGRAGGGFAIVMDVLERFRMTVGAAALGFARRAFDAALERSKSRRMLGGRLFDLQITKAKLADMEVTLNASALLVARAAWELDRGNAQFGRHSSMAKLFATEQAQHVVDAAVQLFGAAGLVRDSLTERLYRQIRSLRIYEGASEIQQMIIAATMQARRGGMAA